MNTIVISLSMFLVLLFTIGAPNPSFASGGGGWEPVKHFDSDLEISDIAVVSQSVEDAQGVRVHELAGDPMFLPGDDHRAVLFLFHPVTVTTYS